MKREEIMAMQAGREIDLLISEKVFGVAVEKEYFMLDGASWGKHNPDHYSEYIAAAWEVVNKTSLFNVCMLYGSDSDTHWGIVKLKFGEPKLIVTAETAPLVICRAALLEVCFPNIGGV